MRPTCITYPSLDVRVGNKSGRTVRRCWTRSSTKRSNLMREDIARANAITSGSASEKALDSLLAMTNAQGVSRSTESSKLDLICFLC